jgi:hypothetical protein
MELRFVWPQASDGAVTITPAQLGLGAGEFGARLDQRSLQRILVVRNMINCRRHKSIESQSPLIRWSSQRRFNNRTQPAADGRQLCSG